METFLSFSNTNSLLSYLNLILIGVIVFYTINSFSYIIDVGVYSITKTFIPIITYLIFSKFAGIDFSIGLGTILLMLIIYFVLGLIIIKIMEKISEYFSSDTIIWFIIIFAIIDKIVPWLLLVLIGLFVG